MQGVQRKSWIRRERRERSSELERRTEEQIRRDRAPEQGDNIPDGAGANLRTTCQDVSEAGDDEGRRTSKISGPNKRAGSGKCRGWWTCLR